MPQQSPEKQPDFENPFMRVQWMEHKIHLKAFIVNILKYDPNFLFNLFITKWRRHNSTNEASSEKRCSAARKISPSIFDLEQKIENCLVLYKIILRSTKGNWKILFFVRMVRNWTKRLNNFEVPCFVQSRTILIKISILSFLRVLPEIIFYRTKQLLIFCFKSKIEGEILPAAEHRFSEEAPLAGLWSRHFVIKKLNKKLGSYFMVFTIKAFK